MPPTFAAAWITRSGRSRAMTAAVARLSVRSTTVRVTTTSSSSGRAERQASAMLEPSIPAPPVSRARKGLRTLHDVDVVRTLGAERRDVVVDHDLGEARRQHLRLPAEQ